jgi:hypothetical protein
VALPRIDLLKAKAQSVLKVEAEGRSVLKAEAKPERADKLKC